MHDIIIQKIEEKPGLAIATKGDGTSLLSPPILLTVQTQLQSPTTVFFST